jgi:hypothetical protein
MSTQKNFDAFLSHNNNDKPAVEQIALWLRDQAQLNVWFDKWNILAGDVWQEEIEKALDQSRSCVVFLGPADWAAGTMSKCAPPSKIVSPTKKCGLSRFCCPTRKFLKKKAG